MDGCVQSCSWTLSTVHKNVFRSLGAVVSAKIEVKFSENWSVLAASVCGGKWARSYVMLPKELASSMSLALKMERRRRSWAAETAILAILASLASRRWTGRSVRPENWSRSGWPVSVWAWSLQHQVRSLPLERGQKKAAMQVKKYSMIEAGESLHGVALMCVYVRSMLPTSRESLLLLWSRKGW